MACGRFGQRLRLGDGGLVIVLLGHTDDPGHAGFPFAEIDLKKARLSRELAEVDLGVNRITFGLAKGI